MARSRWRGAPRWRAVPCLCFRRRHGNEDDGVGPAGQREREERGWAVLLLRARVVEATGLAHSAGLVASHAFSFFFFVLFLF